MRSSRVATKPPLMLFAYVLGNVESSFAAGVLQMEDAPTGALRSDRLESLPFLVWQAESNS
jgi:hypothetical protein